MPWIIEKEFDFIRDAWYGTRKKRTKTVKVCSVDYTETIDAELTLKFKLYDDDGNLHYEGRMHPDCDSMDAFDPLDDYGMPNVGCTYMMILEEGKWNIL
jgi:hypothetical protein